MNPRVNYEMTKEDLKEIKEACRPVAAIMVGGVMPSTPQENANRAWAKLGEKMGFDSMTVRPSGKGERFFTAVPSETEDQKKQRIKEAKRAALVAEKKKLLEEKAMIENRIAEIEKEQP